MSSRFEHFVDSPTLTYEGAALIYTAGPSEELLARFAVHGSAEVRSFAAGKMCLDPATAHRFATDSVVVRRALAHNATLPDDLRLRLAADSAWEVRAAIAQSAHTPTPQLDRLVSDGDVRVRRALCANPHLRFLPHLLERFLQSGEEEFLVTALRLVDLRLARDVENMHLHHGSAVLRRALASNRTLCPESQGHLASDGDLFVRLALAANPSITLAVQKKIVAGPHLPVGARKVLSVLAGNPSLTPEVAELLARPCAFRCTGSPPHTSDPPGQPGR